MYFSRFDLIVATEFPLLSVNNAVDTWAVPSQVEKNLIRPSFRPFVILIPQRCLWQEMRPEDGANLRQPRLAFLGSESEWRLQPLMSKSLHREAAFRKIPLFLRTWVLCWRDRMLLLAARTWLASCPPGSGPFLPALSLVRGPSSSAGVGLVSDTWPCVSTVCQESRGHSLCVCPASLPPLTCTFQLCFCLDSDLKTLFPKVWIFPLVIHPSGLGKSMFITSSRALDKVRWVSGLAQSPPRTL